MTDTLVNLKDAQRALGGISRTNLYRIIGAGGLGVVHIGSRTFIPQSQIDAYIEGKTEFAEGGEPETDDVGGVCDVCGEWFKRPEQHRRMKHKARA
jgi:hypothetical protein